MHTDILFNTFVEVSFVLEKNTVQLITQQSEKQARFYINLLNYEHVLITLGIVTPSRYHIQAYGVHIM